MANKSSMIIRVQSPEGMKRLSLAKTDRMDALKRELDKALNGDTSSWSFYGDRQRKQPVNLSKSHETVGRRFAHGDLIYAVPPQPASTPAVNGHLPDADRSGGATEAPRSDEPAPSEANAWAHKVDEELLADSGLIKRHRNPLLCRHGANAQCVHCCPIQPFDEDYLKSLDPPIKFLSFHLYMRKLQASGSLALENISCRVKPNCSKHKLQWPLQCCSACSPSAITLARQPYRHVDGVVFENNQIGNNFIDFWRKHDGAQRIGIMYGRYERHPDIPLGIRAVVSAIYEPPQVSERGMVKLEEDNKKDALRTMTERLQLTPVGWIFTDLVAIPGTSQVKHYRGSVDNHFLSAEECITAAHFQNMYRNPCSAASEGWFGSKFVTVVITGNASNEIEPTAYQVSNQCMALVRDDCLLPTKDAPELAYVRDSTPQQIVPDVFYTFTNSNGNTIKRKGQPLPVEYLIVDLTVSQPKKQQHTFLWCTREQPAEPRQGPSSSSAPRVMERVLVEREPFTLTGIVSVDMASLLDYLNQFPDESQFLEAISNFNVLLFLHSCESISKELLELIMDAVYSENRHLAAQIRQSEDWNTLLQIAQLTVNEMNASGLQENSGPNRWPTNDGGSSHDRMDVDGPARFDGPADSAAGMCHLPVGNSQQLDRLAECLAQLRPAVICPLGPFPFSSIVASTLSSVEFFTV